MCTCTAAELDAVKSRQDKLLYALRVCVFAPMLSAVDGAGLNVTQHVVHARLESWRRGHQSWIYCFNHSYWHTAEHKPNVSL